ncbi:uncharacterized protein HMPREF1120_05040 [Exophiala dermatitidis NIH/UT8656]|uniref:Uncharacterized protein n=1 Tax=Exophiala dermatitidis (strain ATCC 34100 / CBS 525.76 / NIH/UT8656) TaxID=858893 RepID=H6BZC1_EXODN|nr:uncharacterized protein HMPREF1120_05040 [Exophiala dermatitidis NIH/UT8656]EHY56984.1 hypothetical protein HMPREF1120_05040 [Exophiala dermatitidis NIH/UT8656]
MVVPCLSPEKHQKTPKKRAKLRNQTKKCDCFGSFGFAEAHTSPGVGFCLFGNIIIIIIIVAMVTVSVNHQYDHIIPHPGRQHHHHQSLLQSAVSQIIPASMTVWSIPLVCLGESNRSDHHIVDRSIKRYTCTISISILDPVFSGGKQHGTRDSLSAALNHLRYTLPLIIIGISLPTILMVILTDYSYRLSLSASLWLCYPTCIHVVCDSDSSIKPTRAPLPTSHCFTEASHNAFLPVILTAHPYNHHYRHHYGYAIITLASTSVVTTTVGKVRPCLAIYK